MDNMTELEVLQKKIIELETKAQVLVEACRAVKEPHGNYCVRTIPGQGNHGCVLCKVQDALLIWENKS